jgi:hypothetical protein
MSSFNKIVNRLLASVKDELNNKDNMNIIARDIINPIVEKILDDIYPYFLIGCISFMILVIILIMILFINIRIYYS